MRLVIGTMHFLAHLAALLIVSLAAFVPTILVVGLLGAGAGAVGITGASTLGKPLVDLIFLASYALLSIGIGGFIGGAIMGLYWTITSLLMNMLCGDAFGALMIRDYKHFLRMRFEPDRLTIYPIAIDKVPGKRGWRAPTTEERAKSPSQLFPKTPLDPHLIEEPITIKAADVRA